MVIEIKEKGSKEFYEEVVSFNHQYGALMKKPEAKFMSSFKSFKIQFLSTVFLFACITLVGRSDGFSPMAVCAMTASAMTAFIIAVSYYAMKKRVKMFLEDERTSTITLDDEGIEINKEDIQIIRLGWDNVAFVRTFKESTSFFAKDASGIVISVTNKYKDQIMEYLNKNNIGVQIINVESK
jgi:uncharacterized membrane protein